MSAIIIVKVFLHSTKSCMFQLRYLTAGMSCPSSYRWITSSRLACVQVLCSLQCSLGHSLVLVWGSNIQENNKINQHQSRQEEEEIFHVSFIWIFAWIPNTVAGCSHYDNENTCHIVSKCSCDKKSTHHQSLKTLGGLGIGKLKSWGGEWTRLNLCRGGVLYNWCSQCGPSWIPEFWVIFICGLANLLLLLFLWIFSGCSSLQMSQVTHWDPGFCIM